MDGPTRRFLPGPVACILMGFFAAPSYANLAELPIGHFKIIDYGDEGINVEARCASMTEIVETLVERADKKIVFDKPCYTYVSMYRPHIGAPIEKWIRSVLFTGSIGAAHPEFDGDIWRVRVGPIKHHDPTLTEEEIRQRYADPPFSAITPKSGITGAIFIYKGRYMLPPYQVTTATADAGAVEVRVNEVPIQVFKPFPDYDPAKVTLPPSGQFDNMDDLGAYVNMTICCGAIREGKSKEEALAAAVRFLSTQELIADIYTEDNPGDCIVPEPWPCSVLVRAKGRDIPCCIIYPNIEAYAQGLLPRKRRTPAEIAQSSRERLEDNLAKNIVLIRDSRGVELSLPGRQAFFDLIGSTEDLPVLQRECILRERLTIPRGAREIAVRIQDDLEALARAVQASRNRDNESWTMQTP